MTTIDLRHVRTPEEAKRVVEEALGPVIYLNEAARQIVKAIISAAPVVTKCPICDRDNPCPLHAFPDQMDHHRERDGQSSLPRFNPYSIPRRADPKAVDCPYCVKRPRNLQAHCRAVHPDKPEAR